MRQDQVAELLPALRPQLVRFAFWLCRDQPLAEEIVQEALLRGWRAAERLRDERALKEWLLTIVRREYARVYARKRHETVSLDDLVSEDDPRLAIEDDPSLRDLRRAILNLRPEYREPLVLQVLMGLSTRDIARQLGLTQTAVLTRLCRARNQLRDELRTEADQNIGAATASPV